MSRERTILLSQRSGSQFALKDSALASVKPVHVWPITLFCIVGFENYLAPINIMTSGRVTFKNHVTRSKVKVAVST